MLLGSLWLLLAKDGTRGFRPRKSAEDLLALSPYMKLILAGLACYFVGTILTTALEGTVDWIHRTMLWRAQPSSRALIARIEVALAPLSPKARERLRAEALRFFDQLSLSAPVTISDDKTPISRDDFANKVLDDVLWMEGKLAGTVQQAPFEQYRSEGELRLLTAVLTPLAAVAACFAIRLHDIPFAIAVAASLVVAVVLGNYGLYEYRRANSFVAHHVADGVLFTATMETARRLSYP
jgi:hypothetical protein